MENNGIERLVERIKQQDKIPRKSKKLFPYVIGEYLDRKQLDELKLTKRSRNFAKRIYYILDQILNEGLEKPCGFLAKHPLDIKNDPGLIADIIIEYCIYHKLKTELLKATEGTGITKGFVERRYRDKEKRGSDREQLRLFGKTPELYLLMMDISNNKKN